MDCTSHTSPQRLQLLRTTHRQANVNVINSVLSFFAPVLAVTMPSLVALPPELISHILHARGLVNLDLNDLAIGR